MAMRPPAWWPHASTPRADLLVLGSRTRNGLSRALLDGIGQQCIAEAPCPVLIVKDKAASAG